MTNKNNPCLVSCSVLKEEIARLVKQGELNVDYVFVSKYFHIDYSQIEKNLRPVIERALLRYPGNVILVYGDLCLGADNEMKKLAEEYGIVKIDALNCIDCQLGGKGRYLEVDPHQDLMFISSGMIDFFRYAKGMTQKEGISETTLKELFKGLRGIIILDTLGNASQLKEEAKKMETGLEIIETRHVGCENVKNVIQEAIERNAKSKSL